MSPGLVDRVIQLLDEIRLGERSDRYRRLVRELLWIPADRGAAVRAETKSYARPGIAFSLESFGSASILNLPL